MARSRRLRSILVVLVVAAVVAGGLWTLAAAAQSSPALPPVAPDALVASVVRTLHADPSVSGTVDVHLDLGLPNVVAGAGAGPTIGLGSLFGDHHLRVWSSRDGLRISDQLPLGERSVFVDAAARTAWAWDWSSFTAVRLGPLPAMGTSVPAEAPFELMDPLTLARRSLDALDGTTAVTVDATARVAGRPVYVLVLRPRTPDTLVGRVEIAIDAAHRVPLRVAVTPRGTDAAALSATFARVSFGPIDPGVYRFVPPNGAAVKRPQDMLAGLAGRLAGHASGQSETREPNGAEDPAEYARTFGHGWATVFAVRMPAGALDAAGGFDPRAILPFSGPLFSIRLVDRADHAWLVYGAVPQSALVAVEGSLP
jgi:hypothetical protein